MMPSDAFLAQNYGRFMPQNKNIVIANIYPTIQNYVHLITYV